MRNYSKDQEIDVSLSSMRSLGFKMGIELQDWISSVILKMKRARWYNQKVTKGRVANVRMVVPLILQSQWLIDQSP